MWSSQQLSLLLSTASYGWEQKHEPTLGPALHGVRSLYPSLETPRVGTTLENEPEPGDKAAAGGVRLLLFPTGTFPTNGLHGAREKGWTPKVTPRLGENTVVDNIPNEAIVALEAGAA